MHPRQDIPVSNFDPERRDELPPVPREVEGSRILLVEDDPTFSEFLAWCLADRGYFVSTAKNIQEALELIGELDQPGSFDIVVSDVAMPGGSGTELLFSPVITTRKTPVVLMSAFGTTELEEFIRDANAVFLRKPFNIDSLLRCVLGQLHGSGTVAPS